MSRRQYLGVFLFLALAGALPTLRPGAASAPAGGGSIAYAREGKEIRLTAPDGSNDRRLWSHPEATKQHGVNDLALRPDGKELAFASGHAAVASIYHSDLYAIRPDGGGLRKLTNPPDRGQLARFPKGTVRVVVRNIQPGFRSGAAGSGVFFVYVAGAEEPQSITLRPGTAKTLEFKNVADFGDRAQGVVAIYGRYRWSNPGLDVQAGRTVQAPELTILGDGIELFGAFRPVWRSDGARISYRTGHCVLFSVAATQPAGSHLPKVMFAGKHPLGACTWDWGPTPALADQVLYTDNDRGDASIYQVAEGGTAPGKKLATFTEVPYQLLSDLHWLPDGSGFLWSNRSKFFESSNLFRYDIASKKVTPFTRLENEFARRFSVSPDGQWIVFERGKAWEEDEPSDLWVVRLEGGEPRLLVKNAHSPSWGAAANVPNAP